MPFIIGLHHCLVVHQDVLEDVPFPIVKPVTIHNNDLPFPKISDTCPRQCSMSGDGIDEKCMEKWGCCVKRAYSAVYKSVISDSNYMYMKCLLYRY